MPLLSSIPGLSRVDVQGGDTAEVEVLADPHRLAAYGLGMADLAQALAAGNVLQAVGQLQDRGKLFLVVADRSVAPRSESATSSSAPTPTGVVRVRDLATVQDGVSRNGCAWSRTASPPCCSTSTSSPTATRCRSPAPSATSSPASSCRQGVRMVNWYDQSVLVTQSAASVRDAVLIGLVLAGLVLLVFLRSWRVTLIAVLIVPATLAATRARAQHARPQLQHHDARRHRRRRRPADRRRDRHGRAHRPPRRRAGRRRPGRRQAAVLPAAREFMPPLTGSSLATLIVFVPLGFLSGVTGAFSKALSITMASALAISYLMTAFVVPVLARRLIDFKRWRDPGQSGGGWLGGARSGCSTVCSAGPGCC